MYSIDYENVLLVNDVVKKDYGTYTCKANNDEGEDSFDIILDGTSKSQIWVIKFRGMRY